MRYLKKSHVLADITANGQGYNEQGRLSLRGRNYALDKPKNLVKKMFRGVVLYHCMSLLHQEARRGK